MRNLEEGVYRFEMGGLFSTNVDVENQCLINHDVAAEHCLPIWGTATFAKPVLAAGIRQS